MAMQTALVPGAFADRARQYDSIRADRAAAQRAAYQAVLVRELAAHAAYQAHDEAVLVRELELDTQYHAQESVMVEEEADALAVQIDQKTRDALESIIRAEVETRRRVSMVVIAYSVSDSFGTRDHPLIVCGPCADRGTFAVRRPATVEEFDWVVGNCMLCSGAN